MRLLSPQKPLEEPSTQEESGFEVWTHIYDLGPWSKWVLNSWVVRPVAGSAGVPTAGAFHVGVEVCGIELAYQALQGDNEGKSEKTGVWAHEPKMNPSHVYRESVFLGKSPLPLSEIQVLVNEMSREWRASSYHYVNNNCVDFAEELTKNLDAPYPFPLWSHGLAKGLLQHTPLSSVKSRYLPMCSGSCESQSGSCGSTTQTGEQPGNMLRNIKQAL